MATIIKTTSEIETVEPANNNIFSLDELQKAINGYFTIVPIDAGKYSGKFMIVNEDALMRPNQVVNTIASYIAGQRIVGQVMIIDREQIE